MNKFAQLLEEAASYLKPEDLPRFLSSVMREGVSASGVIEALEQACDVLENRFPAHCLAVLVDAIRIAQSTGNLDKERVLRQRLGILDRAMRMPHDPSLSFTPGDTISDRLHVYCGLSSGMSEVFFCRDEFHGSYCVVKFPHPSSKAQDVFIDECTGWLLVSGHPNIATALFSAAVETRPYLVIDYVAGAIAGHSDLRSLLRLGRFSLDNVIDHSIQFCDGMIWAQQVVPGIVHRDIKPENILLEFSGALKIADWGLIAGELPEDSAGFVTVGDEHIPIPSSPRETLASDAAVGTLPYMSPEQCRGIPVSVASDIYAFGCVVYEMITGQPPFVRRKPADYVHAHVHETPRPLEGVSRELSRIVHKCLEKNPAQRFANFAELQSALLPLSRAAPAKRLARLRAAAESYTTRVERCIGLSKVGKQETALRMIEAIVKEFPNEPYGWFTKGNILGELTRHQEGIAALEKALELDPESPSILYNLGVRESVSGDKDRGRQHLQNAASLGHEKAAQMLDMMDKGTIIIIA